ncbi:MAG: hypothetical protein NTY37_11300, partial [Methanothrix sp.]|nr:hypothetical protein [Methanothrix sp.]
MREKLALLLLLIYLISVTALGNSSLDFFGASPGMGPISLEGNDVLLMPKMSLAEEARGMELFSSLPVYSLNQSIIGAFLFPLQGEASNISVCISPFNLSFYLSGNEGIQGFKGKECAKTLLESNGGTKQSGTSFQLSSSRSGMYSLNFENKSSVLISMPLLITEGQIVLQ